jgi:tripartite-type tricarboxylate transporter receptor subunit TctC
MRLSRSLLGAAIALALPAVAAAQEYPSKSILLVVPFSPGGGIDASARLQAQVIGEIVGQQVIIENIGGAAGTLGSLKVANARPDGYTMLIGNSGTHAYSQSLYKKRPYDSLKDFEPIGMVTESPRIIVARKDLPVNGLKEFVAYAKANQAKMHYGSAGVGSGTHLPCALFNHTVGLKIEHVPFRGAGAVLQEIIAGRVDYMCDTIQTGAARSKSGQVKGIAVMAPKRNAAIPELATVGEQGFPGTEATVWNAFFFPKGTPKPVVDRMHGALQTMLARTDVQSKMGDFGVEIVPPEQRSAEHLRKVLAEDIERWGKLIRETGITVEGEK